MSVMLDLQENIAKVQSATGKLRHDLAADATREYFSVLDPIRAAGADDFEAAQARAYAVLRRELLSADSIGLICATVGDVASHGDAKSCVSTGGRGRLDESSVSLLALGFEGISRPLRIPEAVMMADTKALTLAVAGAAGAGGGLVVVG